MRKAVVSIFLIALLGLAVQGALYVNSYYGYHGFAECSYCHNEPGTAYNSSLMDSSITMDGVESEGEDIWHSWGHTMYIPVAGTFGSGHVFIRTMFAQNSTHIFMKMDWDDLTPLNGTDNNKYDSADGISIMWNINAADFISCFDSNMKTENEGEFVDMWTWKAPLAAETMTPPNLNDGYGTYVTLDETIDTDYVMDDSSISVDSTSDLDWAAVYGNVTEHHEQVYSIEVVRPLVTDDTEDVQFAKSDYYEFAFALYDDSAGSSHTTSFAHSVWVFNPDDVPNNEATTDEGALFGVFAFAIIMVVSSAVLVVNRRS